MDGVAGVAFEAGWPAFLVAGVAGVAAFGFLGSGVAGLPTVPVATPAGLPPVGAPSGLFRVLPPFF